MRMEKIFSFWNLMFIPSVTRFYQNDYLSAVRRSFYILMPFWLTVSFFDILGNLFLNPSGVLLDKDGLNLGFWITGFSDEEYLQSNFAQTLTTYKKIISVGYSIVTMIITITFSARLSEIWKSDRTLTVFCSAASFLMLYSLATREYPDISDYFSAMGMFSAFFLTIISARIFSWLYHQKKLFIKVPKYFPQEMAQNLSAIFPVMLTLIIFSALTFAFHSIKTSGDQFFLGLSDSTIFQSPIFVCIYQFTVWLFTWLGLPGYAITSVILESVYTPAQLTNQIGETAVIFTTGFFEAGVIHILGLMIAILVFSHHESWRAVTKFSLPLMLVNIQEVFLFGLPVVLNPIFLMPYIFAPLANCLVGYIAISWGIIPIFQTDTSWTMPLLFGASAATHSVMGGLLQVVWLIMDIFIYAPFVITANSIELDDKKKGGDKK